MNDNEMAEAVVAGLTNEPYCPACFSRDGYLGTQGAYFFCRVCAREAYYGTPDTFDPWSHNMTWAEAVRRSPFGRAPFGGGGGGAAVGR